MIPLIDLIQLKKSDFWEHHNIYGISCVISEQNWFIFPGQITLKLVLFAARKKYLNLVLFAASKKYSNPVQFATSYLIIQ